MKPVRVMIVDDYAPVRKALSDVLKLEEEIQVVGEASNGAEAIDRIPELSPDVILMDIKMPKMDGLEATRFIKKHFPEINVIMLSAYNEKRTIDEALGLGASGYLTKDRPVEEILTTIRSVQKEEHSKTT